MRVPRHRGRTELDTRSLAAHRADTGTWASPAPSHAAQQQPLPKRAAELCHAPQVCAAQEQGGRDGLTPLCPALPSAQGPGQDHRGGLVVVGSSWMNSRVPSQLALGTSWWVGISGNNYESLSLELC